ncbi:MAG: DUF5988 family protein [Actinomycetota bacterium]|nr:DUF5988 family protein [Actinomycetota bacterium]
MNNLFHRPDPRSALDGDAAVEVLLVGGPAELPDDQRSCRVEAGTDKIKVPYYGGYEHFERPPAADTPDAGPLVFRWTGRTRIAE